MKPFTFIEPNSLDAVMHQLSLGNGHSRLIAGGSDLLGELKEQIVAYDQLVSLAGVKSLRHIQTEGAGLRLGALVTLDELEHDSRILSALSSQFSIK